MVTIRKGSINNESSYCEVIIDKNQIEYIVTPGW